MKKKLLHELLIAGLLMITAQPLFAHGLWVNVFDNDIHPPGLAIANIGFGHIPPMDDFLTSDHGALVLENYELVDPLNKQTHLPKPDLTLKPVETTSAVTIHKGDLGTTRVRFKADSLKGTYQVVAKAKDTFYSVWTDQTGEIHRGIKSMDQIKNPRKILTSMMYKTNSKAYFTRGNWNKPSERGFELEITPLSNLSDVREGDQIELFVSFHGKPVTSGPGGLYTMTGISRTSGLRDQTFLMSYIMNGKCSFRMPAPGQWMMHVKMNKDVNKAPELAAVKDKCKEVVYNTSITFHVSR